MSRIARPAHARWRACTHVLVVLSAAARARHGHEEMAGTSCPGGMQSIITMTSIECHSTGKSQQLPLARRSRIGTSQPIDFRVQSKNGNARYREHDSRSTRSRHGDCTGSMSRSRRSVRSVLGTAATWPWGRERTGLRSGSHGQTRLTSTAPGHAIGVRAAQRHALRVEKQHVVNQTCHDSAGLAGIAGPGFRLWRSAESDSRLCLL